MNKGKVGAIALVAVGIVTLLIQMYFLHTQGRFMVFGVLSSALIVLGIGGFFTDLTDFQEDDGFGNKRNKGFSEFSGAQKAVFVLALLAAAGQFAYFKFGAPLF